jgi:hypothetical protein
MPSADFARKLREFCAVRSGQRLSLGGCIDFGILPMQHWSMHLEKLGGADQE